MEKQKTDFCMGCMSPLNRHGECMNCNFPLDSYKATPRCLPLGTLLNERYLVGRVIGEGSFGVTYIGRDLLLGIIIAIKEYFPLSYGSRDVRTEEQTIYVYQDNDKKGLEYFYKEAKLLSQFHMLDGIVSVRDFFYANKTAYIVMDYIKGITLKEYVKKNGVVEGKEALAMMKPVIRSLHTIHQAEIIHRDISPDNLLLTEQKKLVLVDFGSARVEDGAMTQSMTVMFKRGYTPKEQYLRRGKLGAWSDVYSLCATMYFMLTGIVPNEAIERMLQDTMVPLTKMSSVSLTQKQKNAIMQGVCVNPKERLQSMLELYDALYDKEADFTKKNLFKGKQWKIAIFSILILVLCSSAGWQIKQTVMKQKQKALNAASLTTEYPSALPAVSTPEQIQMQSFAGLTKEQAENRFIALGDEQLSITWKTEYNDTVPKGTVITQNIPENTSYRSGSFKELVLTVSKGVKKAEVPSVTGISYQTAVKKLTSSNLSYRLVWKNSKKAKNMVLKQGKKAGEKVKEGTKIKLTVSKGPVKKPETNTPPASTIQPTQPPTIRVTPKPVRPAPTKKADDNFVGTIP